MRFLETLAKRFGPAGSGYPKRPVLVAAGWLLESKGARLKPQKRLLVLPSPWKSALVMQFSRKLFMTMGTEANNMKRLAAEVAAFNPQDLTRKDLGNEINFENGLPIFQQIHSFFSLAAGLEWENIPLRVLQENLARVNEVKSALEQVVHFTFKGESVSPEQATQTRLSRVASSWLDCYTNLVPHLIYESSGIRSNEVFEKMKASSEDIIKRLSKSSEQIEAELLQTQHQVQETKNVIDQHRVAAAAALTEIQQVAREKGVTQESLHFKKLADHHLVVSLIWLILAVVFGLAGYSYLDNLAAPPASKELDVIIRTMLPRLVVVTIILTGLLFCLRNFSAALHNQTVNRHRQTALTTFKTFAESTSDPAIKNAVLLQATQAIFAPQPSGYLKGENEIPQVNQITEIVRGVSGKT